MKLLKGLALSLLSLLLFLSLYAFGVVLSLKSTILDPDFAVAEVNKMDMTALTRQMADSYIIPQLPQELRFMKEPIYSALSEYAPTLKQQVLSNVRLTYDYFLGKSERLSLSFPLDALKTNLRTKARQAFQQNLPPQLSAAPPATVDQYFNQAYEQYAQLIPPSFTFDENAAGSQTMAEIRQVKQYISYTQTAYWGLIVLMLMLIAGIALISRDLRKISRELGVNFLVYGVLGYASLLATRYLISQYADPLIASVSSMAVPQALLSWLTQVTADVSALAPLQIFSLVLLAAGVALIVFSLVYKSRSSPSAA